jgi:PKD repeat protein
MCAPFDVVFHAHNVLDNSFQYFWDFNDGQGDPFGGTTTQHTYSEPGTYCPSIIMTDANGCDVYILCQEPIVVSPFQATYNTPVQICQGDVVEFTSSNAETIEWLNGTPDSLTVQNAGFFLAANTSMDIVVSAHYSDCLSIDTIHLDVQPLPVVSLSIVDSTCYGAGFIALDGGMPAGPGGQYLMGNTAVSSFNTASSAGVYHAVTYRYTDGNGCADTAVDSIYVIPLPTVQPLQPLTFCAGDSIYTFGVNSENNEVFTIDGIAADYFIPEYRESPYAIVLHVEDHHGCYASSATQFVVLPLAEVIIPAQHFCTGDTIQLSADISLIQGSIQSTAWTIDGVAFANEPNGIPLSYAVGAQHEAQLSVQTTGGCVVTKTTEFQVYDTPVAHFTWSNACEKDSLWLTDHSVIGNDSIAQWMWSAGELTWQGDGMDFCVFDQAGPKLLSLNIIIEHGCSSTSEQFVEVRPTPLVSLNADPIA